MSNAHVRETLRFPLFGAHFQLGGPKRAGDGRSASQSRRRQEYLQDIDSFQLLVWGYLKSLGCPGIL